MRVLPCLALIVGLATPAASQNVSITGEWLVASGDARIRVVDCGDALWGVISWEQSPGGRDDQNPDPSLRTRPTLGMPILLNMRPGRDGWYDGDIYNAQNGRTYSGRIGMVNANTLRVEGCVLGFLCGNQDWSRFTAPAAGAQRSAPARQQGQQQRPIQKAPPTQGGAAPNPVSARDADICSAIAAIPGRSH
jgi:uncharacterized protein (DUF2147 family)